MHVIIIGKKNLNKANLEKIQPLNRDIYLAFKDTLHDCCAISKYLEILEKFNEALEEKPIKRYVGHNRFDKEKKHPIY